MKESPIILIPGGTGVGTSTYSFKFSKALDINSTISTDAIRQVLRSTIASGINQSLHKSTYLAGQTENYHTKSEDVRKAEIIRAYKNQCAAIEVGVEGIIERSVQENCPVIIEGVHLLPGKIKENHLFERYGNRIKEFFVYIESPEIHRDRFQSREHNAPAREMQKYLDHFQEIRWIHDYLTQRANRSRTRMIRNDGNILSGQELLEVFFSE